MTKIVRSTLPRAIAPIAATTLSSVVMAQAPIEVGFLWHMHQPIYIPYLTPPQVDASGVFSFSVQDVHNQRVGPYRGWPRNAIQAGLGQPNLGAQISFSGSLIENLDAMETVAPWNWSNWESDYNQARVWNTTLGNPRMDLVAFGYHHPLMPLLDERDIRMQIKLHRRKSTLVFNGPYGRGIFPAETAFHKRIVPALAAEGIEWALVDNIHFDRACLGYPHNDAAGIPAPNRADQVNPDPATAGGAWVQLQNLWAPTRVSAPFGYQPAWVEWIDPNADPENPAPGDISRIVAVPAARYEGNEDGRGGYGAFLYDTVMDRYRPYNTNPARPMFVMLHHDGDNFGGGSEGYYNHNFQNMVNWVSGDPDYNVSTVDDYLERFPVPQNAVIHVESGSWAGADAGDPEFKKWLGDPDPTTGWSPDRNSWAVLTAARNVVFTAEDLVGPENTNLDAILNGTGDPVERAWRYLLAAQASDHWYWDGTEVWDSNVTVGSNQAVAHAWPVVEQSLADENTPPTVFLPQREPYNPGEIEFGSTPMPADFEVWTYAYDVAGVSSVTLHFRVDADGVNDPATYENETYAGGAGVGSWMSLPMAATAAPTRPGYVDAPTRIATRYAAMVTGQRNALLDYYVEAVDGNGNVHRTDIQHVWVGDADGGGGNPGDPVVMLDPETPRAGQPVTIFYDGAGGPLATAQSVFAHVGINDWDRLVNAALPMTDADGTGLWEASITVPSDATQLDLVFNDGGGTWDNNNGSDWHFAVEGASGPAFVLDGTRDATAQPVAASGGISLWAAVDGSTLYLAATPPSGDRDRFILVAGTPGSMVPAPWAKAGDAAGWDAFVGAESSNDYAGWFDHTGSGQLARGSVLEATLDLAAEFGAVPDAVYVAVASYGTNDGGTLDPAGQAPASVNTDGRVDAAEYARIELCDFSPLGCCPADTDGDGFVTFFDMLGFLEGLPGPASMNDVLTYLDEAEAGCP